MERKANTQPILLPSSFKSVRIPMTYADIFDIYLSVIIKNDFWKVFLHYFNVRLY